MWLLSGAFPLQQELLGRFTSKDLPQQAFNALTAAMLASTALQRSVYTTSLGT